MPMAGSLVLPVVSSVARQAADELVRTITHMWGIDADRNKLERRLLAVQCLLSDAEVKGETNPAVRRWMKDLKAAAYRANDVLDHFQYEALRRHVQSTGSMTTKVLSHFTRENPLLFRLKVSRELKGVLHKIDDLVQEMNNFGLVEHAEVPQVLYRQTHSSLDKTEEIYGRDDDEAVVVKLLLDQHHQQNVQVLPIIGMGGLGKTTLAKVVYNDIRVQKHFELKMWHCVSDNFEAPNLVRNVIELATKARCDLPDNIELLRGKLVDVIGRKRFLLILDDVWNEDEHKWEDHLKTILCSTGGPGSVIVVTSRSQKIASIMGTLPPHELACLSEEDSWKLFSNKAFSKGVQQREEFVLIGRRIVDKCKGLPLALKTMGGLMSSKHVVKEWVAIADSNISDTSRGKDDVLSVLNLSYKYLSSEMKQCFVFCAIFPKDYVMDKEVLIQLWIANNFILEEGMMDLTQKGEFIFNELVWRSFLQDVKESVGRLGHLTIVCKMHDLMHDLAKDATKECASAEELLQENVPIKCMHHIEIPYPFQLTEIKGLLKRASSLRTLLTESRYKDLKELKLKSVRALRCKEPSHSLAKYSKYLQYLDLSGSDIVRLPDSICMMYNLRSLRLNRCYGLQYLPEGLATSLRKLSHIYLLDCNCLEEMPPKLSLLNKLRTLTKFVVGTKDGCGIEELKGLQQLSNRLELCKLRKVKRGSKANLNEKHNLCELLLNWNHNESGVLRNDDFSDDDFSNDEEILESLVSPSDLKVLVVHEYHGLETSQWMRDPKMFQCLRTLRIFDWPRCKDIPLIWLSSSLENLHLANLDSLTTLCKNIDLEAAGYSKFAQVFPRLKSMTLDCLPNLERWKEEPCSLVMFPQLEELQVTGCQKLTTLPEGPLLTHLCCRISMNMISSNTYCAEGFVPMNKPMSMPLANWPSLVKLDLGLLADMDVSLEEQQGQSPNTQEALQYLNIVGDDAFTSILNLRKLQLGLAGCLAHVENLKISGLCNIVRWPVEELQYLPGIRSLWIWACKKLGEEGLSSEAILPLPMLKELIIEQCGRLLEIPQLPPSLETLLIYNCTRLVALPSNLGNLVKLKDHAVYNCGALKTLPDGMDGLTSLEELTLVECPGIEEFPQGLLQRLPSLENLRIEKCANLERRCREGGEYFDLVSSIPKTHIGAAVEPELREIERPAKRFLPLCGSDSQLSSIGRLCIWKMLNRC